MTDHQTLEPLIKRNRSNQTYDTRLTRWLDRLPYSTINVNLIVVKHLALADYLSRNPISPPQTDDTLDEEYVNNSILTHYNFISQHGCLSNHINQPESQTEKSELKTNNKWRTNDARQQVSIECLYSDVYTRIDSNDLNNSKCIKITMDARMIDSIEASNPSAETTELINRWKEVVKPGIYHMTRGWWKRYHEPKILRLQQTNNDRGQEDLRQRIGPQHRRSPTSNRTYRTMNSWSNLGDGPTKSGPTVSTWETRSVVSIIEPKPWNAGPHKRRRNWIKNRPSPSAPRSTGDDLGNIHRIEKCSIRKNGTRPKKRSRRTKRQEPGTSSTRNGEVVFYRPFDDRNHKRPKPAENSGMSGKTTTWNDTTGILNI